MSAIASSYVSVVPVESWAPVSVPAASSAPTASAPDALLADYLAFALAGPGMVAVEVGVCAGVLSLGNHPHPLPYALGIFVACSLYLLALVAALRSSQGRSAWEVAGSRSPMPVRSGARARADIAPARLPEALLARRGR